ncbi:MAG TPA: histidine triad nucleotide-binding protein [Firmicutes bacterium]|nr:histidine triad nucleotide-binding protein [Bacillota bacterium]
MSDCVFCKIVAGEIPSKKAYEDEQVLAFYDIEPKAPVHILVIPKQHLAGAAEITAENSAVVAHVFEVIARLTRGLGLADYRVVTNNGADAGQTVHHLHFHVLAGGRLGEMA